MRWDQVRRFADPLLGVAVAALYAGEVARWGPDRPWLLLVVCWVGCAGLALRRSSPLVGFLLAEGSVQAITAIEPGFDNDSAALVVTFFVALYSLGRHAVAVERWLGAVGVVAVMVFFSLGEAGSTVPDTGDIGFVLFFVGTPWAAGLVVRIRLDRERTLRAHNAELRRDQDLRARAAVTAERARIARELHDVVSHAIAVTVLQARGGRKMLGLDQAEVRRALDAIELTNTQALGDMRRLLAVLRDTEEEQDPTTSPQPSLANLDRLVERVRATGLAVQVEVEGDGEGDAAPVPPGVDLSAYRIVQEGLTNVIKHAGPGARARVHIGYSPTQLTVTVADDGVGDAPGPDDADTLGHGLVGIRERVAVIGGRVEAAPGPDGGFVVTAQLPYALEQLDPGMAQ